MMIQAQVTVQSQVFISRECEVFAGLDVDKHRIAVTLCNHEVLLRSLGLHDSAAQLLNYVRKRFPAQRVALVYEVRCSVRRTTLLLSAIEIQINWLLIHMLRRHHVGHWHILTNYLKLKIVYP